MASGGEHGVRRSRRDERREETRAELVAAAAGVFARRGFHAASVEEIANEAGYSTGAIYWHFAGKDELFLAVFEAYSTTRVREFAEIRERAGGELPERARAYADHWMERVEREPEFMVLTLEFIAYAWRNPDLRKALADRRAAPRLALGHILEGELQGQDANLPLSAEHIAAALRELGVGLGLAKLVDPEAIPTRLFGDFVELFFSGLLGNTEHTLTRGVTRLGNDGRK
jgi:AcrR family transcriptional regulator